MLFFTETDKDLEPWMFDYPIIYAVPIVAYVVKTRLQTALNNLPKLNMK